MERIAARQIGKKNKINHDFRLLIPKIQERITPEYRNPMPLIANDTLEKIKYFEFEVKTILASRLRYIVNKMLYYRGLI